jgi:flagellar protein FlgJ
MPSASSKDSPEKIHDAAQQFESLLIGQLLKTSREAGGSGWLGTDQDDAGATAMEMAEQQFAKMLASSGGLGLSRTIETGLQARASGKNGPASTTDGHQ